MGWAKKAQGSTPLGDRIKQERLRLAISPDRLAAMIGCAPSIITGVENRGVIPHVKIIAGIAIHLNCTVDWLLGFDGDPGHAILTQIGVRIPDEL